MGLICDLHKREFAAPGDKVYKVKTLAKELAVFAAAHRRWVNKRVLAKFVGTAIALSPAIPAGRFHLL